MKYLISLIAGGILPLAFAPFYIWPLAIFSIIILLYVWEKSSPKQALFQGFCYGLGMYGVGVSWVFVSIHKFGNTSLFLAFIITCLFISILSLFPAIQGYILKKLYKSGLAKYSCIGFPCIWVIFEWIRSWLFTGFPWLYLGYSQTNGPLKSFAPIIGVYGISFLIVLSGGIIYYLLKNAFLYYKNFNNIRFKNQNLYQNKLPIRSLISITVLVLIWGTNLFFKNITWTKPVGQKLSVALLQGNIPPLDKFLLEEPIVTADRIYGEMTKHNLDKDLIIWPENSIPLPLPYSKNYLQLLHDVALANNTTIILGLPIEAEDNQHYYNALVTVGNHFSTYHKQQLVPFGDYLPFEKYLRGLIGFFDLPMSSFINGNGGRVILDLRVSKIVPLICYEIAFPEDIRNTLKQHDGEVIVTISEDGWFGKSIGPHQHFQIAKMRALETGRYVLRATTSGISAIIAPNGKIEAIAPQFKRYSLEGEFFNMQGKTLWIIIGVWPLLIMLFLLFILFRTKK